MMAGATPSALAAAVRLPHDRTHLVHGLQVATELHRFIEDKVLPGTGVDSAFWKGFDAIVADLAPKNIALLAERDRLQTELDAWHKANPGPITDMAGLPQAFLEKIGYLVPQPAERARPPPPTWTTSWPCRPARSWWCPS
jgi:malate synthase